jgi:hypothetical protein
LKKKSIPQNQAAQPDITDSQESDVDPQPGPSGYNPQPGPSGVKQVAPGSSRYKLLVFRQIVFYSLIFNFK